jgi:hypothetical protein
MHNGQRRSTGRAGSTVVEGSAQLPVTAGLTPLKPEGSDEERCAYLA